MVENLTFLTPETNNSRSSRIISAPRESVFARAPVPSDPLSLDNSSLLPSRILARRHTCVAILAAFYPETKGRTLEEIDGIFGKTTSSLASDEARVHDEHVADEQVVHQGKL